MSERQIIGFKRLVNCKGHIYQDEYMSEFGGLQKNEKDPACTKKWQNNQPVVCGYKKMCKAQWVHFLWRIALYKNDVLLLLLYIDQGGGGWVI